MRPRRAPSRPRSGGRSAAARSATRPRPRNSAKFAREAADQLKRAPGPRRERAERGDGVSSLGDYFQYVIDRPVDLARQKSALLPIVNKDVEGKRVSIYNPAVQPKHPLLGLKFKNTTGMPLTQGPITVFEGSVYAGDTRVLDLQPDEERLVSYAIDLGTEVAVKPGNNTSRITSVKAVKGIIYTNTVQREERVYDVSQPLDDRPHPADRAPEPQGPGLQVHRREQAEGGGGRRVPLRGAGRGQEGPELHGHRGAAGRVVGPADEQRGRPDPLLHQPEGGPAGAEGEAAGGPEGEGRRGTRCGRTSRRPTTRIQTITADQKRLRDNLRETAEGVAAVQAVPEDAGRPGEGDGRPAGQAEDAARRRSQGAGGVRDFLANLIGRVSRIGTHTRHQEGTKENIDRVFIVLFVSLWLILSRMNLRCPVCRAENTTGPACRRCRADLTLLIAVEARRESFTSPCAVQAIHAGRFDDALEELTQAEELRAGPDVRGCAACVYPPGRRLRVGRGGACRGDAGLSSSVLPHPPRLALPVGLSRNPERGIGWAVRVNRAGPRAGIPWPMLPRGFCWLFCSSRRPVCCTPRPRSRLASRRSPTTRPSNKSRVSSTRTSRASAAPTSPPAPRTLPSDLVGTPDVVPAAYGQVVVPGGELPTPPSHSTSRGTTSPRAGRRWFTSWTSATSRGPRRTTSSSKLIPPKNADKVKADPPPTHDEAETRWELKTLDPGQSRTIELAYKPNKDETELKIQARVQFDFGRGMITTRVAADAEREERRAGEAGRRRHGRRTGSRSRTPGR